MLHCFDHHSRHLAPSHDRATSMPATAQPAASYSCPPSPSSYRHASERDPRPSRRCSQRHSCSVRPAPKPCCIDARSRPSSPHAQGSQTNGRQSTVSDQLLLLRLRQLVGVARSHKQQEKTKSHRPGRCGIPRQVPHTIHVFPEEFVPNGDVLFHLPHLRQSLLPVLCHKPRAKNRCAATVRLASPKTPAEPAPHCPASQDRPSAPRPAPIPGDTRGVFSAPPKAPTRTA
ncbi:hypothetical protein TcCL_NonESM07014 [Trypanosoma cruzi]|nr:hypothetical protein TcCL_NonESM07014 [Trypanosoma cruzi]